jgi:hypothetical protein
MPSSPHRRRIEIPAPLYETIAAQARRERRPVAAVVVDYLLDGMSVQEHYGPLAGEVAALRREVRQLTRPPPRPPAAVAAGEPVARTICGPSVPPA